MAYLVCATWPFEEVTSRLGLAASRADHRNHVRSNAAQRRFRGLGLGGEPERALVRAQTRLLDVRL